MFARRRASARNRPQPFATVRNRSQPFARLPYGRAYGVFCKTVIFGSVKCRATSFRVACVALCDIPICFRTYRNWFCVSGAPAGCVAILLAALPRSLVLPWIPVLPRWTRPLHFVGHTSWYVRHDFDCSVFCHVDVFHCIKIVLRSGGIALKFLPSPEFNVDFL